MRSLTVAIITIFNSDGGVGKTTIAFSLAVALASKYNKRVRLIDADPNSTSGSTTLKEYRDKSEYGLFPLDVVKVSGNCREDIEAWGEVRDFIIVDCGGQDNTKTMLSALCASDAAFGVFSIDGISAKFMSVMDGLIEQANGFRRMAKRYELVSGGIINKCDPIRLHKHNMDARKNLEKTSFLHPLKTALTLYRSPYTEVTKEGAGLCEIEHVKANFEMNNLLRETCEKWL